MRKEKEYLKVLIADDSEIDLKLLELRLLQLGFRNIVKAGTGMEALELVMKDLPDLIFLDILMPRVDGGKVREHLKASAETRDIPTIFVSCIISQDEAKRIRRLAGGDLIISKPYSSDQLSAAIDKALRGFGRSY